MSNFLVGKIDKFEPIYFASAYYNLYELPNYINTEDKTNSKVFLPPGKARCNLWTCKDWGDNNCAAPPLVKKDSKVIQSYIFRDKCIRRPNGGLMDCECDSSVTSTITSDFNKFCTYDKMDMGEIDPSVTEPLAKDANVINRNFNIPCLFNFKFEEGFSSNDKLNILSKNILSLYENNMIFCQEKSSTDIDLEARAQATFRNFNIVYAIILDFYNVLYKTRIDFLDINNIQYIKDDIISQYEMNLNLIKTFSYYNEVCTSSSNTFSRICNPSSTTLDSSCLKKLLLDTRDLINEPRVEYKDNKYKFIFDVSYLQYKSFFNNKHIMSLKTNIQNFLINFFNDDEGELYTNNISSNPQNPEFNIESIDINISTMSIEGIERSTLKDVKYKTNMIQSSDIPNFYFFTTSTITLNVEKWSPMLLLYFINKDKNII